MGGPGWTNPHLIYGPAGVPAPAGLSCAAQRLYLPTMPFPTMPNRIANRESEAARRHPHPERETLELGPDHGVTKALAKASITMDKADLWRARLAIKTLRKDQREAIAEVTES